MWPFDKKQEVQQQFLMGRRGYPELIVPDDGCAPLSEAIDESLISSDSYRSLRQGRLPRADVQAIAEAINYGRRRATTK
jgi:hypothetical protein